MSGRFEVCKVIRAAKGEGQDCAVVIEGNDSLVIAVADGAGGMAGGRAAAEAVALATIEVSATNANVVVPHHWEELIRSLDAKLATDRAGGETTAVVLVATSAAIAGASVGDSEAWLIHDGNATVLTASQNRKPLVGSGRARPIGFGPIPFRGPSISSSALAPMRASLPCRMAMSTCRPGNSKSPTTRRSCLGDLGFDLNAQRVEHRSRVRSQTVVHVSFRELRRTKDVARGQRRPYRAKARDFTFDILSTCEVGDRFFELGDFDKADSASQEPAEGVRRAELPPSRRC
jgi:hypothetical protein